MTESKQDLILACPHCQTPFVVRANEINCGIFRCAVNLSTQQQANPHLTQAQMEKYMQGEGVVGCG